MILILVKTNHVRTEQLRTKEVRFFLNHIIGYQRYVTAEGIEEVCLHQDTFHASHYKSVDWDKESWEQFIKTLENYFSESNPANTPNPSIGTTPDLNYYY